MSVLPQGDLIVDLATLTNTSTILNFNPTTLVLLDWQESLSNHIRDFLRLLKRYHGRNNKHCWRGKQSDMG